MKIAYRYKRQYIGKYYELKKYHWF